MVLARALTATGVAPLLAAAALVGLVGACSSSSSTGTGSSGDASASGGSSSGGSSGASGSGGSSSGASGGGSGSGGSTSSSGASGSSSGSPEAGSLHVGDPCTSSAQCPAVGLTTPVCMTSWPNGGACTDDTCAGFTQCPSNAQCSTYQGVSRCFAACNPGSCRAGYTCNSDGACVPSM